MERIDADVLIPGHGEVVKNGCVVLDGARIAYAGPVESAPNIPGVTRAHSVPAIMPGMWDCHAHFMGLKTADLSEAARSSPQVTVVRAAKDAELALQVGFTSVREAGGYGVFLGRLVEEGTLSGPHIYGSGAILSATGGHGDLHSYPLDWVLSMASSVGFIGLCNGVDECLRAVRSQLRLGARVIKVCASGGVLSKFDSPINQQFTDAELRAIVEVASMADRIVMAHCHGKAGIMAALNAGCYSIEHGSYLDEEAAELMVLRKAILVPTRFIINRLRDFAEVAKLPEESRQKLALLADRHQEAMRLAVRKGVQIALGTDIQTSGAETAVPWGMNASELSCLIEAGMTPLQAIEAATAMGPLTLGAQAPKSGQLRAGYDADILALARNPVQDVSILADARNIVKVWMNGKLVKSLPRES
jgi:imidazolonepropionase-like amidohydrolase